jgi:hypothetical protein
MCESVLEWIQFWLGCLRDGFEAGDYLFGISEFVLLILSGYFTLKKLRHRAEKWEETSMKWGWIILGFAFAGATIFVAPFLKYSEAEGQRKIAQTALDDKSPKLDGFIDQWMIFVRPGETNTTIVPQIHINNYGGSGSLAENFKLKFILATNDLIEAKPIDIPDYYEWRQIKGDQAIVFRLHRQELISEKTSTAIETGFGPRGWLAFTVPRILSQQQLANYHFVISFLDAAGNETLVTNGFWKGKAQTNTESFDIPRTFAGSVNLVYTNYQLPSIIANGWMPPELPPDCTNVIVFLGSMPVPYPRWFASGREATNGIVFNISDLPDSVLSSFENDPSYSPLQETILVHPIDFISINGVSVPFPVQPIIVSNRLYIEVEVPFSNEKYKLLMNNNFDANLLMTNKWDRNYSTNYDWKGGVFVYEVVNELKNPVLQVGYTAPNEIHVNGIFQVDSNKIIAAFNQPPQMFMLSFSTQPVMTASLQIENFHETLNFDTNETIADFGRRLTNEFFRPIFKYQRPIFKYPSNRKLGVFEDWPLEANNKSVTNTLDKNQ